MLESFLFYPSYEFVMEFIMVIALSGALPLRGCAICNHKFDFRLNLHKFNLYQVLDIKFNFHFIIFTLKSTSGNISLLTKKNTPVLTQLCNITARKENGRHLRPHKFKHQINEENKGIRHET